MLFFASSKNTPYIVRSTNLSNRINRPSVEKKSQTSHTIRVSIVILSFCIILCLLLYDVHCRRLTTPLFPNPLVPPRIKMFRFTRHQTLGVVQRSSMTWFGAFTWAERLTETFISRAPWVCDTSWKYDTFRKSVTAQSFHLHLKYAFGLHRGI